MEPAEQHLVVVALDTAFNQAFAHLSSCRTAYEDNPRDPDRFAALGAARAALEDARKEMNDERIRLGLEPRQLHIVDGPKADGEPRGEWQGVYQQ